MRRLGGLAMAALGLACAHPRSAPPAPARPEAGLEIRFVSADLRRGEALPSWAGADVTVEPGVPLTFRDLKGIELGEAGEKAPSFRLRFTDEAARRLERLPGASRGRRLAVVIRGKVAATPRILRPLSGGRLEVTGLTRAQLEAALGAIAGQLEKSLAP